MKSPRIYLYKITFEEIPDWYWGIHKENSQNDGYLGSPVTHAWKWEFYTPHIEVCQVFDYSEEGWGEAQLLEKRVIRHDLNNSLCLNEHCGGKFSLKVLQDAGRVGGVKAAEKLHLEKDEMGRSVHGVKMAEKLNAEKDEFGRSANGVRVAEKLHKDRDEQGRSLHSLRAFANVHNEKTEEGKSVHAVKSGSAGGRKAHEEKTEEGKSKHAVRVGRIMTEKVHEERDEMGRSVMGVNNANKVNSQVWESSVDGFRSTAAGVVSYHKGQGWDPNARRRVL